MLKITKRSMVLKVSKGAFRELYSRLGWVPLEVSPPDDPQEPYNGLNSKGSDNSHLAEENSNLGPPGPSESISVQEEDFLGNMSIMELKQYASLLGLNVGKLKSRESMIQAIKKHEKENS